MSYLSRLKQLSGDQNFTHSPSDEPTKPPKAPFVSSGSTVQGAYENISANDPAADSPLKVGAGGTATDSTTHADARMEKVIAKLHGDPGLRYAMEVHDDAEVEAVILTLAIRDKAACELRIPKSRYDAFALLELIERHTTIAILQ